MPGDMDTPRLARYYNALGSDGKWANEADREFAALVRDRYPAVPGQMQATRAFHARAARAAVLSGARGVVFAAAGLPGAGGPPWKLAAEAVPSARYVLADPSEQVCLIREVLRSDSRVAVTRASARDPEGLMSSGPVRALGAPVQVHLQMCAHFWDGATAADITARYARLLPSGSSLVMSLRFVVVGPAGDAYLDLLNGNGVPANRHTAADLARWLAGAGLVVADPPGICNVRSLGKRWGAPLLRPRLPGMIAGVTAIVR